MSEPRTAAAAPRPGPHLRGSHGPGWIWAVPVAAAGILLWLGLRFFVTHGISATVQFSEAPDVEARTTKVTLLGVKVGQVSDVAVADDGQHVEVSLALDRSTRKYLRCGTRFWLQGVQTALTDPSALKGLIAGPTIVMQPGPGAACDHFQGEEGAPVFAGPVQGRSFILHAQQRGSLQRGSEVYYLGLKVGKVTALQFQPPHDFRFTILIRTPYDQLVHPGSRFWDAGALQISFDGGLSARLLSPAALLSGAVAFDTPPRAAQQAPSADNAGFELYHDRDSAELAPQPAGALYRVEFQGSVGSLKPGAPVKLRGFTVGAVRSGELRYDSASGTLSTPVTLELDPQRLHLDQAAPAGGRQALNQALAQLIGRGLRARLQQQPPLLGGYGVTLDFVPQAPPVRFDAGAAVPELPAAPGGSLGEQISALPIRQIGENIRQITARIRALTSSPQLDDSIDHLDRSLAQIDRTLQRAGPQVPPLVESLRKAAAQIEQTAAAAHQTLGGQDSQGGMDQAVTELTRTARSVRALADYLDRHPEALLRGKP